MGPTCCHNITFFPASKSSVLLAEAQQDETHRAMPLGTRAGEERCDIPLPGLVFSRAVAFLIYLLQT